jgi:hypothetical protein
MISGIDGMAIFIGTLIIVVLCSLAMALGLLVSGRPLSGGCGSKPRGTPRCEDCPRRKNDESGDREVKGETAC